MDDKQVICRCETVLHEWVTCSDDNRISPCSKLAVKRRCRRASDGVARHDDAPGGAGSAPAESGGRGPLAAGCYFPRGDDLLRGVRVVAVQGMPFEDALD